MIQQHSSFIQDLNNYADKLEEFVNLLDQEHESVKTRDIATLEQCTKNKQDLLAQLEQFEAKRNQYASDPKTKEFASTNIDVSKIENRIKALLVKCRELNEVNGAMIDISQQFSHRMLGIILGDTSVNTTYDAEGKSSSQLKAQSVARI